ncbi:uncharacterized protein TNCV_1807091 [Trichonephila clavipes]|nr:uncharacterized protein TNCV_1807091 [Trichonephila clavipes]
MSIKEKKFKLSKSGSNSVYLKNVALDTAGAYKCQVSTDAPTYSCVQAVKEMDVIKSVQEENLILETFIDHLERGCGPLGDHELVPDYPLGAQGPVLPMEEPKISGITEKYDFGDNITLKCTSAKSKPASKLRWLVNNELVDDNVTIDHGVTVYKDNLEITSKTLNLPVSEALLSSGKVAVKCEASFYDRLTMNSKDMTILGKYVFELRIRD